MTSSDASHEANITSQSCCNDHYSSPTHHVHVSSPTHSVSSSCSDYSTSDSECPTPTNNGCIQQVVQAENILATKGDSYSFSNKETTGSTQTERPFSWENLSEVEDEETAMPAMTEPEQVELSPQQFSAFTSQVSSEQPLSLQEAFRQHKAGFISSSQSRKKQKSKERMIVLPTKSQQHNDSPAYGISKESVTTPKTSLRVVQFSSPLITLQDTGVFSPPTVHRTNSKYI